MRQHIFILFTLLLLAGCSSTPKTSDPSDPYEGFNRAMYTFNDTADRWVIKPVAKGYKAVTPDPVEKGVSNFFSNLGELTVIINDGLQGKGDQMLRDSTRFMVNSTLGVFGIFDVATPFGLPKHNEDFGQTLATWGVGSGPYLVLPLLGPSTVRDTTGFGINALTASYTNFVEHVPTRNSAFALNMVSTRANLLNASSLLDNAALDPYVFLRNSYLQRRNHLIYDGNPPDEMWDEEDEDDDDLDDEDFN